MSAKPMVMSTWPRVWPDNRRRKIRSIPIPISPTAMPAATRAPTKLPVRQTTESPT